MDFGQVGDSVGYLLKEYIIVNTILHPKYSASNPEFGIWDFALSSRYKGEIWDLQAKLGLFWDHFRTLVSIGTKSQIWDLVTSTD